MEYKCSKDCNCSEKPVQEKTLNCCGRREKDHIITGAQIICPAAPVQEKPSFTLQEDPVGSVWFNGVEYVPRVPAAPVGEEWEKEWDKKIKTYDKDGGFIVYVEGYENTDFDVDLMKSYISKLLQDEREKAWEDMSFGSPDWREFYKKIKQEGAKAERQRIEDAVRKLMEGEKADMEEYYMMALDAVLKVIRGEDIKS